jgi:hypothetical protein
MKQALWAGAALAALASAPVDALEPFKTYDSFSTTPINPTLWNGWERTRQIKSGQLNLVQRDYGLTSSDSGSTYYNWSDDITDYPLVTELRAKVTVNALEVNACASNASVGLARARIYGSFYNVGTPVAGSQTGDALAQVRLYRLSNSTDAPGLLQVQGLLANCTNTDCSSSNTVGTVALGTITVGTATTVQLQWDKPNKQFLFSRDSGSSSGTIKYTDSDAQSPGVPFKRVGTRTDLASCLSNPRVTGYVDASFDNVSVNKSAAP